MTTRCWRWTTSAATPAPSATESRPALIVFTSDHGENLFDDERQRFMHAHPDASRWDLEVPLMFWGMRPSTPYVQRNGSIWRSIAACAWGIMTCSPRCSISP